AHTPEAVRAALAARGWDAQPAWFAATGVQPLAVILEDLTGAEREALVHWGAKAGADVLTGEGWALVGAAASRLAPLARPDRVPAGLERLGPELGRGLAAHADPAQAWEIAAQRILLHHPVIIGIINVPPYSLSGRGRGGGRDPHAHARHARYHGFARHLPPRGGRGRRGARRGGAAGGAGRGGARPHRRRSGVRVRQDPGAELPPARRAGNRRGVGLSCSGRAVPQTVSRARHRAAGGGPGPGDGRGVRPRVGAGGAAVSGPRRRRGARGAAGGPRYDELTVNFEAYRFLIPQLWPDVVEILLVAFVIYRFLLFLVGTRAMQIVVGVMILSVAYFAALLAKFEMISFLLKVVFTYGPFAAVVVFQPELRNALAR